MSASGKPRKSACVSWVRPRFGDRPPQPVFSTRPPRRGQGLRGEERHGGERHGGENR
jgi:hypothetical protein